FNEYRTNSAHPRAETHISENQVGVSRVRGENLRSIDAIAGTFPYRTCLQVRYRRARFGLGHADRDHALAREQLLQEFLLLRERAVLRQHADRPEIAGLHHVGAARAGRGNGLDRDHRVHQRAALAAVGFGVGDAEQALRCHQPGDVPGIAVRMRARVGAGGQVLLGKAAHCIAELLLLGRVPEIHAHSFSTARPSTATTPSRLTSSGLISASSTGRPGISASREIADAARASAFTSPRGRLRYPQMTARPLTFSIIRIASSGLTGASSTTKSLYSSASVPPAPTSTIGPTTGSSR